MSVKLYSLYTRASGCSCAYVCVNAYDPNRENGSVQSSNKIYEIFACQTHNDLPCDPISSKTENGH